VSRTANIHLRLTEFQYRVLTMALAEFEERQPTDSTSANAARVVTQRIDDRLKWSSQRKGERTP